MKKFDIDESDARVVCVGSLVVMIVVCRYSVFISPFNHVSSAMNYCSLLRMGDLGTQLDTVSWVGCFVIIGMQRFLVV